MWHGPLRTNTPTTRINDDLILSRSQWDTLIRHQEHFLGKTFKNKFITRQSNDTSTRFSVPFLNHCFVYVITETVAEYPYPYFSEKTWKAMTSKVPFMIVGSPGSLAKLQEFGFKTFSNWWSEDYDTLPTAADRIEAIVTELKKLSTHSVSTLAQLHKDMQPIVQHNFNHMAAFIAADIANVQNKL